MKVREGFVSNSSSSSFIITEAKTTSEVAREMIDLMERNQRWYDEDEGVCHTCGRGEPTKNYPYFDRARDILDKDSHRDEDIVIPWSCNYPTYIFRDQRGICVDTCRNESWEDLPFDLDYRYGHSEDYIEAPYGRPYLDLADGEYRTRKEFEKNRYGYCEEEEEPEQDSREIIKNVTYP